jgi:hypothetical protein
MTCCSAIATHWQSDEITLVKSLNMMAIDPLSLALIVLVLLQVKHVICDGPLQTLAMVQGKSIYGKPVGILHALIHGAGTCIVLAGFGFPLFLVVKLAALEVVLHYHIDYVKENLVKSQKWSHLEGPFWWALTADQALHHMTYVLLVWIAFRP